MKYNHKIKIFIISILSLFLLQNCSDKSFTSQENASIVSDPNFNISYDCIIGDEVINENESKLFYLSSSVPYGSTCESEIRLCVRGLFAGRYQYTTCEIGAPQSCLNPINGSTLSHGTSFVSYQNPVVPFDQPCVQEQRTCTNGSLSGSGTYTYSSCRVALPADCPFNGALYPHGSNITAFAAPNVNFGSTCQSETRTCYNGNFSGSFAFASCGRDCQLNGVNIDHGESVTAYSTSMTYGMCSSYSQIRTCNNGVLSGNYPYDTCTEI
jgi:hypothetical protein